MNFLLVNRIKWQLAATALLPIALFAPLAHADVQPCIGFSGPLTGPAAFGGAAVIMGAQTAIDEINAKGGVLGKKISLKSYDDAGAPPRGVDNTRRLAQSDQCVAILGGYHSGVALAMHDPIEKIGIPYIGTIAAGTKIIEPDDGKNEWLFRVSAKDRWVAQFLTDVAIQRSKNKKIGVFYENTGWGNGVAPEVTSALKTKGVTLASGETFNWGDQDMTPQLIRARDKGVDTIVVFGLDREGNQILRSMQKLDYHPTIVGAWGLSGNLAELAGPLSNGVLVFQTFSWMGQQSPRTAAVYKKIAEKYQLKTPADLRFGSGTANAYDAVYILAAAIESAHTYEWAKVRDALYQVKYDGLVAKYNPAFEKTPDRHDAILPKYYKLSAWYNGQLLPVEQTPYK